MIKLQLGTVFGLVLGIIHTTMNTPIKTIAVVVALIFASASCIAQTITLTDNDNSAPPVVVELGSTLTILAGDCPISEVTDENFIVIDVLPAPGEAPDQLDPIDISSGSATVTLPALGEYVINCGCPALPDIFGMPLTCVPAGNVMVVEPAVSAPIPTLGEWGLIFVGLILAILGIAAIRQRRSALVSAE